MACEVANVLAKGIYVQHGGTAFNHACVCGGGGGCVPHHSPSYRLLWRRPETSLVSVMALNNEIGVIQPLAAIGSLCRERKVFFHTDAAQMLGKVPLDVNAMNIDLMSMSGHKVYGPKGVGGLFVRRRPRVRVDPIFSGGGQER